MKQSMKREITYWVVNLAVFIYLILANTTGFVNSLKMWIVISAPMFIGRGFENWIDRKSGNSENN